MKDGRVEQQFSDSEELYSFLMQKEEVTFASYIDNAYKKILILSGASFFETIITEGIKRYSEKLSPEDQRLTIFIEKKALKRQYHSLFDWDAKNTNKFWNFFGDEMKSFVRDYLKSHPEIEKAERDFVELGHHRNLLVHENFAEFDVNITRKEIYEQYCSAKVFVDFILSVLDPDYKAVLKEKEKVIKGKEAVEELLRKNGGMSIVQIASSIGKSEASVRRYIKKLTENGDIEVDRIKGKNIYKFKTK